ncbi:hypothetical protein M2419_003948 [Sphingobacterium sp. BIGb0116]|nr:hypothetical protein [Sphingobacterium sp. BIGb0116]
MFASVFGQPTKHRLFKLTVLFYQICKATGIKFGYSNKPEQQ